MFGNVGYVPTELNTADDPTRGVAVRNASKELAPSLLQFEEGDDKALDDWLDSYGAGSYQCSGLPPLTELREHALDKPLKSRRILRHREYCARKAVFVQAKTSCTKRTEVSPGMSQDSPPLPSSSTSVRGSASASTAKCGRGELPIGMTVAEPVRGCELSGAVRAVLKRVPLKQFLVPESWLPLPPDWRPSRPGFLDLYSGKKGVARELCEQGDVWTITFEIDALRILLVQK